MHDVTSPEYIGPGVWRVIHSIARRADTDFKEDRAIEMIWELIDTFPCEKCAQDGRDHWKRDNIFNYIGERDRLGIFRWTVNFHNTVNLKLNKKMMDYDIALSLYDDDAMCSLKSCSV